MLQRHFFCFTMYNLAFHRWSTETFDSPIFERKSGAWFIVVSHIIGIIWIHKELPTAKRNTRLFFCVWLVFLFKKEIKNWVCRCYYKDYKRKEWKQNSFNWSTLQVLWWVPKKPKELAPTSTTWLNWKPTGCKLQTSSKPTGSILFSWAWPNDRTREPGKIKRTRHFMRYQWFQSNNRKGTKNYRKIKVLQC